MTAALPYQPKKSATNRMLPVRGLRYHLTQWGTPQAGQPLLVMTHGFMDVGASFQFVVDALHSQRCVIAPDWRGFGLTEAPTGADAYWFADYLGDLDALLDALSPDAPVDLLGHSMGGNVVMTYAGVRPHRVRRLINLEGFGLPDCPPQDAAPPAGHLAGRTQTTPATQALCQPGRGGPAAAQEQPPPARRQGLVAGGALGSTPG
jgi:pimeloyl-ACP methyl ester carboxylesterase